MKYFLSLIFILAAQPVLAGDPTVIGIANTILDTIIRPIINVLLIVATLVFIFGVIEYVLHADNEEGRITGRRHMMYGVIGLAIMISAVGIVGVFQTFWGDIASGGPPTP